MTRRVRLRLLELEITALNAKGHGVGKAHCDDGTDCEVEVPFTAPGDYVKAMVRRKRRRHGHGTLLEILRPSPERRQPLCRHFSVCGGCSLQHFFYAEQLRHKQNYVEQCFAKFVAEGIPVRPIVSSPSEWAYRNKMEYTFSNNAAGERFLGLIIKDSKRRVLNLTECHLVEPWFTVGLEAVRQWWQTTDLHAYHVFKDTGTLRTLVLRESKSSGDRMAMLTVSGNPDYAPHKAALNSLVAALRAAIEPHDDDAKLSIFLRIQQASPGMTTNFYEMLLYGPDTIREVLEVQPRVEGPQQTFRFQYSPTAFFQPNPQQTAKLYSLALQLAEIKETDIVYDLYCGIGTVGICASSIAKEVIGIEISPEAALDARLNAKLNGADNVAVYAGAVRHVLSKLKEEGRLPQVVFVDPPRPGLDPLALRSLVELRVEKLIYISCNPTTQARDVEWLVSQGYKLLALQPVDQFPQVGHVENVALLTWSDG